MLKHFENEGDGQENWGSDTVLVRNAQGEVSELTVPDDCGVNNDVPDR